MKYLDGSSADYTSEKMSARSQSIMDSVERNQALYAAWGVGALMGCGEVGCVFQHGAGNVVKITVADTLGDQESDVAKVLQTLTDPGIPRIHDVFWMDPGRGEPATVCIVREPLNHLPVELLWPVVYATGRTIGGAQHEDISWKPHEVRVIRHVVRALLAVQAAGITPRDLHQDNWGIRGDGTIVIRDFGAFTFTH